MVEIPLSFVRPRLRRYQTVYLAWPQKLFDVLQGSAFDSDKPRLRHLFTPSYVKKEGMCGTWDTRKKCVIVICDIDGFSEIEDRFV